MPGTYPNGVHVAEVEIDPETGDADVVKYTAVNDFGTVINPMLVEGQIQGGVVQGLGQALLEGAVYDAEGQLLTGSFMDYAMPRAHDAPNITVGQSAGADQDQSGRRQRLRRGRLLRRLADGDECGRSTRCPNTASATSTMPATPARIWQAIQDAKQKSA